ncbi:MAG: sigma-70 family RNA polymerase sigma factor [Bacteroidales bacterium]|nr:sigma-70 family RNA polymerase sigma factor [Bacteroidales bacterium]
MKRHNIDDIIKGCISGKRASQQKLFEIFSNDLFGVCLYYSRDYTEAEDTLHEGFMKIFQKISQFKGTGSFEGWMKRIMINTALEKYRKNNQMYAVGDDEYQLEDDIDPVNVVDDLSVRDLLDLIRELTPQYRMVFNLYAVEGYSHKEISEMLGISEGTSKSNLARARNILQKKVKEHFYISSIKDAK